MINTLCDRGASLAKANALAGGLSVRHAVDGGSGLRHFPVNMKHLIGTYIAKTARLPLFVLVLPTAALAYLALPDLKTEGAFVILRENFKDAESNKKLVEKDTHNFGAPGLQGEIRKYYSGAMAASSDVISRLGSDCRRALGNTGKAGGGTLQVKRWRAGTEAEVIIPTTILGNDTATAPYSCLNSKKIFENSRTKFLRQFLAVPQFLTADWCGAIGVLALPASVVITGDAYDTAMQTRLQRYTRSLAPADLTLDGCNAWQWSNCGILRKARGEVHHSDRSGVSDFCVGESVVKAMMFLMPAQNTGLSWTIDSAQGITVGVNDSLSADLDTDGISNLMEFARGGARMDSSRIIVPKLEKPLGNRLLEYGRCNLPLFLATTQVVKYGSDLIGWTQVIGPAISAVSVTITPGSPSDRATVTTPNLGT